MIKMNKYNLIKNILQKYFPSYDILLFGNENIVNLKGIILNEIIRLSLNNNICITFYILDNYIIINVINRVSLTETTTSILQKFILFGRELSSIIDLKGIKIGSDESSLIFKSNNYKNDIPLMFISLLAYGQTFYNRLGFGKQDEEWNIFINESFIEFLNSIEYSNNEYWKEYEGQNITTVFKDIINKLKFISRRDLLSNIIDDNDVEYIINVRKLIYYIIKNMEVLPEINEDLTLLF